MYALTVGGLLTEYKYYDFKEVRCRPLAVEHMPLVQDIAHFKRGEYVNTLLCNILDIEPRQVLNLTLGDIVYIFTLMRYKFYTDTPTTVEWKCSSTGYVDGEGHFLFDQNLSPEYVRANNISTKECDRLNTQLIYSNNFHFEPVSLENFPNEPILRIPTLFDRILVDEISDRPDWKYYQKFEKVLLCIRSNTVEGKLDALNDVSIVSEANDFLADTLHGVEYSYTIRCDTCGATHRISKMLDIYSTLPVIDQTSVMNIQYTCMRDHHVLISEDTPILKAIYWFNLGKKEKMERAALRRKYK